MVLYLGWSLFIITAYLAYKFLSIATKSDQDLLAVKAHNIHLQNRLENLENERNLPPVIFARPIDQKRVWN
jgi:hypothetical protein